jgi:hypothetical protein
VNMNHSMTRRRARSGIAAMCVGLLAFATACGDDDDDTPDGTEVDVVTSDVTETSEVTVESEVTLGTTVTSEVEVTEVETSEVVSTEPGVTTED